MNVPDDSDDAVVDVAHLERLFLCAPNLNPGAQLVVFDTEGRSIPVVTAWPSDNAWWVSFDLGHPAGSYPYVITVNGGPALSGELHVVPATRVIARVTPRELRPGGELLIQASGLPPDASTFVSVYGPDPAPTKSETALPRRLILPQQTADAEGEFQWRWKVPASLPQGLYALVLTADPMALPATEDTREITAEKSERRAVPFFDVS